MKNTLLKSFLFSILIAIVIIIAVVMFLAKGNYDDSQFKKFPDFYSNENRVDILKIVKIDSSKSMEISFPNNIYQLSDNWKTVKSVREDLVLLDSLNQATFENMNVLSMDLTTNMKIWQTTNLDSLNLLLNWAEKFNTRNVYKGKHDLLNNAVFDFWIGELSTKLDNINQADYSLKFNYKFRYLRMRCCELGFGCGDRDDNFTKAVQHVIDKDWFYLLNRFSIGTSVLFKFIVLILILITCYGYYCVIIKFIKK